MAVYNRSTRILGLTPAEEAALSALLYSYVGGKGGPGSVAATLGAIGEAMGERFSMIPAGPPDRPKFDVTNCQVKVNLEWPYRD